MAENAGRPLTAENKTFAIRADIAQTRADMTRTVDAIEERLSPAHLKEQISETKDHIKEEIAREIRQAKTAVRDATVGRVENMVHDVRDSVSDAGTSVLDTIKANPIPAAMVAVGLGWLLMGGGSRRTRTRYYRDGWEIPEYEERGARRVIRQGRRAVADTVSNVGHRVEEGASHLVDQASGVAHDVGDKAQELAIQARETGRRAVRGVGFEARRVERTVEDTMRENPLVVGAIAIAVGAAIGLSLPHTTVEDNLMGEAKEKLLQRGKGVAEGALQTVEQKVGELTAPNEPNQNDSQPQSNGLPNGTSRPQHV
jgi:hypothetical protein